jgi:hypothetical protein
MASMALAGDRQLSAEVDELMFSRLSELPVTDRLWEAGEGGAIELDSRDLLALACAANQGLRAAILRLAEEVEALKREH